MNVESDRGGRKVNRKRVNIQRLAVNAYELDFKLKLHNTKRKRREKNTLARR